MRLGSCDLPIRQIRGMSRNLFLMFFSKGASTAKVEMCWDSGPNLDRFSGQGWTEITRFSGDGVRVGLFL